MTGGGSAFGHEGSGGGFCSSDNHHTHGSAFSNEGSFGAIGSDENYYDRDRNRQNHPWYPVYDNPPYLVHQHHERSRGASGKAKCFWWCITSSIGIVIGSLWMLFGFYGSEHFEMGLNYSRLLTANRLFVQGISVQNREPAPGPLLYVFHSRPSLDDDKEWKSEHHVTVPGFYHKEWAFWLNRGSEVKLKYNVHSASSLFIIVAQGEKNFKEWIQDTGNPEWCLLWRPVHGDGDIHFEATKDDNYYIVIANFHQMSMDIMLKMEVEAKVYETDEADLWCPLDAKPCTMVLSLKGSEVGLVTAPDKPQEGHDVWYITVSYNTRWATYIVIYGALALMLLLICCCRPRSKRKTEFHPEVAPINVQAGFTPYSGAASVDSSCQYDEPNSRISSGVDRVSTEMSDENLCTICFEEHKNSFFQPCGHCATCYTCGLRVKEISEICPICRQPIQDVRKIFIT